jgi:sugar lactone lactonase YvrE
MGSKSKLFRFDRDLKNPKLLAEGLRGCCQRCDIVQRDGVLYLAENSVHRVVRMERDGQVLGQWGERSRTDLSGFGSCCNPMNLCFDADGVLYTAESGLGRVKRYTSDGKFLGLAGYIGVERFTNAGRLAASCSNIAIAVTPDGTRVYVMDVKNNLIRVLQKKDS